MILISWLSSPILILITIFICSFLVSLAWPAVRAAYADYISETESVEKEIEGLADFFTNLGYVIGPILAGFLADQFGEARTFSILGLITVITTLVIIQVTPKEINVKAPSLASNK